MSAFLTLDGLSYKTPDGHPLFDDLTLAFGAERTGLVGRNGVGKTTLIRLMLGEIAPAAGAVVVRGRTVPGAVVDVKVNAVGTLVGAFGLNQELLAQRVQADGNGDFSFSFTSQIPLPGTRYEVTMNAERGGMAPTETQLVLFQK